MTQKEDWNYSTQELLQKFDVTEQGLNNDRVEEIAGRQVRISCRRERRKALWRYF